MQWVGRAAKKIDSDMAYRRRLFEKTGLAMTADGSDDNLINLEGVTPGTYSFMDVGTTPEPDEDIVPMSPAPADEEHPPGSRDENESDNEEGEAASQGKGQRKNADEITILDIDDDLAGSETPLPLKIPSGYALAGWAPGALTTAFVKPRIRAAARCGLGHRGHHATGSSAHTPPLGLQSFLDGDGSTRSFKLPLEKYFMDGAEEMGSWALLHWCEDALESSGDESEEGEEFEECDSDEEEGPGGGGGRGGTGDPEADSKEDDESEESEGAGWGTTPRDYVSRREGVARKRQRNVRLLDQ